MLTTFPNTRIAMSQLRYSDSQHTLNHIINMPWLYITSL